MRYFEASEKELTNLLRLVRTEKQALEVFAKEEKDLLEKSYKKFHFFKEGIMQMADLSRRFASELHIKLEESIPLDFSYPCIKCNISRKSEEKIYHLPFDQQYDNTKIERESGELYCSTIKEAEGLGFRRAKKYLKKQQTH